MSRDALVVGINCYQWEGLPKLKSPARDAEAIAQLLERYGGFRVIRRLPELIDPFDNKRKVSRNKEVTVNQLTDAIQQLFYPGGGQPPETALLYFSGHGLQRRLWGERYKGYLATSDVNLDLGQWGFELSWLPEILGDSKIHEQIVWLDCCHSGELLREQDEFLIAEDNLQQAVPGSKENYNRCLITASRGFEAAFGQIDGKHGVLTAALLQGLDPTPRSDGFVTSETLSDCLKQKLIKETQCPLFHNYGKPIVLTTRSPQRADSQKEIDKCPYKGLEYFDLEDAQFFYGRRSLTDRLRDKVEKQNFLAVIGPSGSGKSSVVRAGLLYELKLGQKLSGSNRWQYKYKPFTPGEHPLKKLEEVIGANANELAEVILADEHQRVILFIDQFEECFTLCKGSEEKERERQQFFDCLLNTLKQTANKLCLIIAIRADFLGKCAEDPLASEIITSESLELVRPMSREELKEAIKEPAHKVGLQVDPLLVSRMIEEVEDSPGSLPLLEFTLTKLYEARKEPFLGELTLFSYDELGGLKGTLEKFANDVYDNLSSNQKKIARQIFIELTQLGEGTEDTRRRITKQDLVNNHLPEDQDELNEVIGELANKRLITTSGEKEKEVIDIAHEALIRHWQQLRGWLNQNRDALREKRKIEEAAKLWVENDKYQDFLWGGSRLANAEEVLQESNLTRSLSPFSHEFLEASRDQELRSYLQLPAFDNLDQMKLDKEAAVKSFLTKSRLEQLLEDESEKAQVRLAASWGLKQWGEKVPIWLAEIDEKEQISLRRVEPPPTVVEDLGNGITLEMVKIPGGEFWMGAPEGERGSQVFERPQHKVRVSPFLMGKYPVSQAQWRAIASLSRVERDLNLKPSHYQGDNRPVEQVSWYDAVEFCKRLGRKTGRDYRLPSEVEWEYACRAGTTTHFHFGETILPDLANYGETSRGGTTPLGRFQVANAFGLYDMHGQLWEWCADNWHDSYDGAPTDGIAWLDNNQNKILVVRGGSWSSRFENCRSAYRRKRDIDSPKSKNNSIGLRVVVGLNNSIDFG